MVFGVTETDLAFSSAEPNCYQIKINYGDFSRENVFVNSNMWAKLIWVNFFVASQTFSLTFVLVDSSIPLFS